MIEKIESLCRKAGSFQLEHFQTIAPNQVQDKGLNQLVSFVDIETEKILVDGCQSITPNCGFITEENTIEKATGQEWIWIIDPLDGTTNFLHGLPAFSISIALMHHGELAAGAVYVPTWNEMFTATKGGGAFLNGQRITVSPSRELKTSLIATGFPYYEFQHVPGFLNALKELMQSTHGLRRMGSAAIDLAYTACGRFDGFFESGLNPWDIAAGILLIKEAGGTVSDYEGTEDCLFGKSILASSFQLYPEFYSVIKKHLL